MYITCQVYKESVAGIALYGGQYHSTIKDKRVVDISSVFTDELPHIAIYFKSWLFDKFSPAWPGFDSENALVDDPNLRDISPLPFRAFFWCFRPTTTLHFTLASILYHKQAVSEEVGTK